jgi:hypothetical protein
MATPTIPKIDKRVWQETLKQYRALNEAEFREKIRNAGKKSPLQKWREFLAIMEFGLKIKPQPSEHEQRQKVEMLNRYYEHLQRFEVRRAQRGEPSETRTP